MQWANVSRVIGSELMYKATYGQIVEGVSGAKAEEVSEDGWFSQQLVFVSFKHKSNLANQPQASKLH